MLLDDWIETQRHDVTDEYGCEALFTTAQGREVTQSLLIGPGLASVSWVSVPAFEARDVSLSRDVECGPFGSRRRFGTPNARTGTDSRMSHARPRDRHRERNPELVGAVVLRRTIIPRRSRSFRPTSSRRCFSTSSRRLPTGNLASGEEPRGRSRLAVFSPPTTSFPWADCETISSPWQCESWTANYRLWHHGYQW